MKTIKEEVDDINEELFEENNVPQFWLRYIEDGYVESIKLIMQGYEMDIEVYLWNSENEEREFHEDENKYEDFKPFLKRKVQDCLHLFSELKGMLNK